MRSFIRHVPRIAATISQSFSSAAFSTPLSGASPREASRASYTGRGFLVQCTCELAREHCATISGWDGCADHRPTASHRASCSPSGRNAASVTRENAAARCTKAEINRPFQTSPRKDYFPCRGEDVAKFVRGLAHPVSTRALSELIEDATWGVRNISRERNASVNYWERAVFIPNISE